MVSGEDSLLNLMNCDGKTALVFAVEYALARRSMLVIDALLNSSEDFKAGVVGSRPIIEGLCRRAKNAESDDDVELENIVKTVEAKFFF